MSTSLYIFPSFSQLVQYFPSSISSSPLLPSFNSESIILYDTSNNTFIDSFDISTSDRIVNVSYDQKSTCGKLVSVNEKSVVLEIDDSLVTIRNYKTIIEQKPESQIKWQADTEIKISYLFSGVAWNLYYTLILDRGIIQALAKIENNTHYNLNIDSLSLMSGRPQTLEKSAMTLRAVTNEKVTYQDEYMELKVDEPLVVGKTVNLKMFEEKVQVARVYRHDLESNDRVRFGFKFRATANYPPGNIQIYNNDLYLGSAQVPETQSNEYVNVEMTETTKIRIVTRFTKTQREPVDNKYRGTIEDIQFDTFIKNPTSEAVTIILELYVGQALIKLDPEPSRNVKGYAEFDVKVKALSEIRVQGRGMLKF